jgi:hypothetical protein
MVHRAEQNIEAHKKDSCMPLFLLLFFFLRYLYECLHSIRRVLMELPFVGELGLFRAPAARSWVTFKSIEAGRLGFSLEN